MMQRLHLVLLSIWILVGCGKMENEPTVSTPLVVEEKAFRKLSAIHLLAAPVGYDAFTISARVNGMPLFESQRFGAGFAYRHETLFRTPLDVFVASDDVVAWNAHGEIEQNHEWSAHALGSTQVEMHNAGERGQVIRFREGLIVELMWIER